jgi:hypothetical protein
MFNSYNCCSCINGYSPYILNGECRFCYGKKSICNNNKINNTYYDKQYYNTLQKINNIITNKTINDNYN